MSLSQFSDAFTLDRLVSDAPEQPMKYQSISRQALNCLPNAYEDGVEFETKTLMSSWNVLKTLALPLRITSADAAGFTDVTPELAFKHSALSLISGIAVHDGMGRVLVDDRNSLTIASNLRMLLSKPENWYLSNASEIQAGLDYCEDDVPTGLDDPANIADPTLQRLEGGSLGTAPVSEEDQDNPIYNKGFAKRHKQFLEQLNPGGSTTLGLTTQIHIPLALIHPFLEQLSSFPIINTNLVIKFYMNTALTNSAFKPLCVGKSKVSASVDPKSVPKVDIDTNGIVPRIWYDRLIFNAEQNAVVSAKLASGGFTKHIRFTQYDVNRKFTGFSGPQVNLSIQASVQNPKRVYALVHKAGVYNGTTWPSPLVTGSKQYLDNVNVVISGRPYLSAPLDVRGQWDSLQSIMPPDGFGGRACKLSYEAFLKTYRIAMVDISRTGTQSGQRQDAVELTFTGILMNDGAGAVDLTFITERETDVIMRFGAGDFEVVTGSQLFQ